MAQQAFDHWFNTIADPAYADRCHRKKKFRQRKSPIGNYQVDEDVWARHPADGIMYIASVIATDSLHRTCRVMFVNSEQTFDLAVNQLRHVTLEDIRCNRYVDYEHDWIDNTKLGVIITYNRYGEQRKVEYTGVPQEIFTRFLTIEEDQLIDDDKVDLIFLSSSETNGKDINLTSPNESIMEPTGHAQDRIEAFRKLLPIFLEEMDSSELLDIWPDLDIDLIEQSRRQSSLTESTTLNDDSTSVLNEQTLLTHKMDEKLLEIDKFSQELLHQHLMFDQRQLEQRQSSVIPEVLTTLPVSKEVGTQTESITSLSMVPIDGSSESSNMIRSNQLTKYNRSSVMVTSISIKREKFWSRFRLNQSFIFGFTKSLPYIILTLMLIYHLSIGSTFTDNHINSTVNTKVHMVSTDVMYGSAIVLFVTNIPPLSSILNGPSRSMFELWPYPFAIP